MYLHPWGESHGKPASHFIKSDQRPKRWVLSTRGSMVGSPCMRWLWIWAVTWSCAWSHWAWADVDPSSFMPVERYQLDNGLTVLLNPDDSLTTVAVCVTYAVGSRDEPEGQSGFAHLFGHLMFQGSRNVEPNEHFTWTAQRGGEANSIATKDRSAFYQVLPEGHLPFGLWLEADRMKSLALNRQNFERQREIVLEKYHQQYAGRTYEFGRLRLHQLIFQTFWPYEHPVIGWLEDLETADYSWAAEFYRRYYAPNNATLSISGKFSVEQAKQLVQEYFASAQSGPEIPAIKAPKELPRQTSERFNVIVDPQARTPGVYYGWRIPSSRTREHRALQLAASLLAEGETASLKRRLIHDSGSASRVRAWTSNHQGPDAFQLFVQISRSSNVDANQKLIDAELRRLRNEGPTEQELERAKHRRKTRWLRRMQHSHERALLLGELEALHSAAHEASMEFSAYDEISRSEVRAAAAKYLIDTRRSIVEVYPPGWVRDLGPPVITRTYVVTKGDTLIGIGRKYGVSAEAIAKQNGISVSKPIVPGQRLLLTVSARHKLPKVRTYTVKKGDTLIGIAKKHGVAASDLAKANGIKSARHIQPGQELTVPPKAAGGGSSAPAPSDSGTQSYTIQKGDTLSGIAHKFGVSTKQLANANGISTEHQIQAGRSLKIPKATGKAASANTRKTYTVKSGDTLIGIAKRFGTSATQIAAANGFSTERPIRAGQSLVIPSSSGKSAKASPATRSYTVKKGDTLIGIAKRFGISAKQLAAANRLSSSRPIYPGQKLVIPSP